MSFPLIKGSGFSFGEVLTSADMTQLDIDHSNAVDGSVAGGNSMESRSVTRHSKHCPIAPVVSEWVIGTGGITTVNTAASLVWPIDIPHGATITDWTVNLKGAPAHGGMPAQKPRALLQRTSSVGVNTTIGTLRTDPETTTGAYQANHTITGGGGLSEVVNNTTMRYFFGIESESGANALAGLIIYSVSVTFTTAALDEGGA